MNASIPHYAYSIYGEIVRRHAAAVTANDPRCADLHEMIGMMRAEWPEETKAWDERYSPKDAA